jgi:hypothetical protein
MMHHRQSMQDFAALTLACTALPAHTQGLGAEALRILAQ